MVVGEGELEQGGPQRWFPMEQSISISITWQLVKNAKFSSPTQEVPNQNPWSVGPCNMCSKKISGDEFENHVSSS